MSYFDTPPGSSSNKKMAPKNFIKITTHPSTGQIKLAAVGPTGEPRLQYVPDVMAGSDVTYVFDDPRVLAKLIVGLSVKDTSGKSRATGTLALMRKIKLQVNDQVTAAEKTAQEKRRQQIIGEWKRAIQQLPQCHRVSEVQLDLSSKDSTAVDVKGFVEPMTESLSSKAGRRVNCMVLG